VVEKFKDKDHYKTRKWVHLKCYNTDILMLGILFGFSDCDYYYLYFNKETDNSCIFMVILKIISIEF
jgi:hypothetical protein